MNNDEESSHNIQRKMKTHFVDDSQTRNIDNDCFQNFDERFSDDSFVNNVEFNDTDAIDAGADSFPRNIPLVEDTTVNCNYMQQFLELLENNTSLSLTK